MVQVSCLTFISGADNENSSFPSPENQPEYKIWKVYFSTQQQKQISNLQEVKLNQNMFQETAAFIILHVKEDGIASSSLTPPNKQNTVTKKSIYFWFGKRTPEVLRIETVKHVVNLIKRVRHFLPGQIPIYRCVSGSEPEEFQMITRRPYTPVNKLYKVKGTIDAAIVQVPLELTKLTYIDPFVLSTSTYVIVFIPPWSDNIKSQKAFDFGLYLHDRVNRNEKDILFIDCRAEIKEEEIQYFESFLNEINASSLSNTKLKEMLHSLCSADSHSHPDMPAPNIWTLWEEDSEFEEKRKNTVNVVLHYYNEFKEKVEQKIFKKGIPWNDIWNDAESHTLYVEDKENEDLFVYLGNRSSIKEIRHILRFAEIQSKNWKNLKIVQSTNLPVDFLILFPDCCQNG